MPFKSKAQKAFLEKNKPELAAEFAAVKKTKPGPLPNHVKKPKKPK